MTDRYHTAINNKKGGFLRRKKKKCQCMEKDGKKEENNYDNRYIRQEGKKRRIEHHIF